MSSQRVGVGELELPGMDGDVHRAAAPGWRCSSSPPPWRRTVDPDWVGVAVPSRMLAPVSAATFTSAGAGEQLGCGRELHQAAAVDHPDLVGQRGGVLERVGDQQRREGRSSVRMSPSSSRTCRRVIASSAPNGSSSSSTRGSRASARASATRWRSPPESCPRTGSGEVRRSRGARAGPGGRVCRRTARSRRP